MLPFWMLVYCFVLLLVTLSKIGLFVIITVCGCISARKAFIVSLGLYSQSLKILLHSMWIQYLSFTCLLAPDADWSTTALAVVEWCVNKKDLDHACSVETWFAPERRGTFCLEIQTKVKSYTRNWWVFQHLLLMVSWLSNWFFTYLPIS